MSGIIFVSAFLDLGEDRSKDKSVETCFQHFYSLAQTGIPIHLFLSPCYKELYESLQMENVVVEYINLSDLDTYREIQDLNPRLPTNRTAHHDTRPFLTLMNAKVELVHRVAETRQQAATHYAWIDFSIFHVFKRPKEAGEFLQMLSNTRLRSEIIFPGCWWHPGTNGDSLFHQVNWRFCGGFFVGSVDHIAELNKLYRDYFRSIVDKSGLTWEVNMWAHFENRYGWSPKWFKGDHNDSIIRVPADYIPVVASLTTIPSRRSDCILAISSLIAQVDHIYLSVCKKYERFEEPWETPEVFESEPYASKLTIVYSDDYGPATKYIGAVDKIPANTWVFICDDDQIYHPNLILRMKYSLQSYSVLQNHCEQIRKKTSGGLIHGYVGLFMSSNMMRGLKGFDLPQPARFVDDQWASIYCFKHGIPIVGSTIEEYREIFEVLQGWHERIGVDSVASLNNRAEMVRAIAEFFSVRFLEGGGVQAV